ncbi:holin family protein [Burkholderiaceae bacterium DAT-1]|nr:holin family protein [Burkholderiaceae bacterium DAT-1]
MSFIGDLLGSGDLVKSVGDVVDKFVTTDKERLELQIERDKADMDQTYRMALLDQQLNVAQTEVNKVEAANPSLFVAGWRPAIGWVCALALFYQFLIYPVLLWLWPERKPGELDLNSLYPLIFGMLGIAGMRSYEKLKGVETKVVGGKQVVVPEE